MKKRARKGESVQRTTHGPLLQTGAFPQLPRLMEKFGYAAARRFLTYLQPHTFLIAFLVLFTLGRELCSRSIMNWKINKIWRRGGIE